MKVLMPRQVWVFDQNVVWTADGRNVRVTDMPARYRGNVVRWLERQVSLLAMNYGTYCLLQVDPMMDPSDGKLTLFYDVEEKAAEWVREPLKWLHSTPLVERLEAEDPASIPDKHGLVWQEALPNPDEENVLLAMLSIKLRSIGQKVGV